MSFARRLAISALLIAIAPALVLAAIPLKYCASSSGHHALEVVIGNVIHGGHDASHHSSGDDLSDIGDAPAANSEKHRCSDTELTDVASVPAPLQLEVPPLAVTHHPVRVASVAVAQVVRMAAAKYRLRSDPRMTARHTTVLRI